MKHLWALPRSLRGSYLLVLRLDEARELSVGRLGTFRFEAGHYAYVGSALNGLRGRILRHLRGGKRHWHLDYLLPHGVVEAIWVACSLERLECRVVSLLDKSLVATVPGFGASDCHCVAHLFRVGTGGMPTLSRLGFEVVAWEECFEAAS